MARMGMLTLLAALVAATSGCGNYKVTFETADVINAWGDDTTKEQLDVDIVCLSGAEAEKLPEIVNKSMRSDEWFRLREQQDPRIGAIPAERVFALRSGAPGAKRDTLKGPALLSTVNRADGQNRTTVEFRHPKFLDKGAAIVIYGRFVARDGLAKTEPVVIAPPPGFLKDNHFIVRVGRDSMAVTNWP